VAAVPVHSCVPLRRRGDALAVETAPLELVRCRTCGFVFNAAFDVSRIDYAQEYEETQAYSPRFRGFLDQLVVDLLRRLDLADGRVLEVGCGKGEFLAALCSRSGVPGLGIDPAWQDRRRPPDAPPSVRYVRDTFGPGDPRTGTLVVCRHTLEHVPDVRQFLSALGSAAIPPTSAVFVEVPDAERILADGAFWDVYHEHCSYFTEPVLADLARRCGLLIEDLGRGFDDQYLLLHARSGVVPSDAPRRLPAGPPPPFDGVIAAWQARLEQWAATDQRVVLWGGGSKAVAFLTTVARDETVAAVVDINPHKADTFVPVTGHRVVGPDVLVAEPPDVVVVMNPVYENEVRTDLEVRGLRPRIVPVTAEPSTAGR
jgi:SAM-dependent methyltransferase